METYLVFVGLIVAILGLVTKYFDLRIAYLKFAEEQKKNGATKEDAVLEVSPNLRSKKLNKVDLFYGFGLTFLIVVYLIITRHEPMTRFDLLLGILAVTNYAVSYVDLKHARP